MPHAGQIRGMLLEEFLLHLLRCSGYVPIENAGTDPTLQNGPSGLEVKGRGTEHQIDAIADYRLTQPFGYRQRLLVEAKCYHGSAGIEVVRNAIGVIKDVSEFWRKGDKERFHYSYALFCTGGFSPRAEECAFAQDIYPIPLARSAYLRRVTTSLWDIPATQLGKLLETRPGYLSDLRKAVRESMRNGWKSDELSRLLEEYASGDLLNEFLNRSNELSGALLAVTHSGFLIMLVPPKGKNLRDILAIAQQHTLRMFLRPIRSGWFWFLETEAGERLFSLDIPPELFRRYESPEGDRRTWHEAKHNELKNLQVVWAPNGNDGPLELINLRLNDSWLEEVKRGLDRLGE